MGGPVYRYDVEDLSALARGLSRLSADYEQASRRREEVSGDLGYGSLREAVEGFTEDWDHERGKQREALGKAAEALEEIVRTYEEHDRSAAAELRSGS